MTPDANGWTHVFPRGDLASGRLTFESGVGPRLDVRGATLGDDLARCRFPEPTPRVNAHHDEIAVDYRGFFRWFFLGRYPPGAIELNDAIPWAVNVEGGVASVDLDLRRLQLTRFDVGGGAAKVELHLGKPHGIVPIRISGGAARLAITYPPAAGTRLRVTGGVAHLDFDQQKLGAVGGGLALTGRAWDEKGDGYDIKIGGGAARLSVGPE